LLWLRLRLEAQGGGGLSPYGTGFEDAPTHFAVVMNERIFRQKFKLIKYA